MGGYFSMKTGIQTGSDNDGRFFTDFSKEKVQQIVAKSTSLEIVETWITADVRPKRGKLA